MDIGIIGGTGPAGRGLALRAAMAGTSVVIGSRQAERASEVAADVASRAGAGAGAITGAANEDVCGADLVVVATPWEGTIATVSPLAEALSGRVVVSMVNALVKEGRSFLALVPPRGSMAGAVQAALPSSLVSAAFHHLPASQMERPEAAVEADVLVCSDHPAATAATIALVDRIGGLRGVDAGDLAQAAAIEAFTAVLITVNIRNRAHAAIRLTGMGGDR
jgi:hypothetical protein